MTDSTVVQVDSVSHRYRGGRVALSEFSAEFGPGVTGVVGANGAGKTTLMRLLATIRAPTAGRVSWFGMSRATGLRWRCETTSVRSGRLILVRSS